MIFSFSSGSSQRATQLSHFATMMERWELANKPLISTSVVSWWCCFIPHCLRKLFVLGLPSHNSLIISPLSCFFSSSFLVLLYPYTSSSWITSIYISYFLLSTPWISSAQLHVSFSVPYLFCVLFRCCLFPHWNVSLNLMVEYRGRQRETKPSQRNIEHLWTSKENWKVSRKNTKKKILQRVDSADGGKWKQ